MVKMVGERSRRFDEKVSYAAPGEQLPAEDIVGGLIIMKRLMQEIKYGHKKMSEIPDTPEIKATMPALAEETLASKNKVLAGQLKHFSARLSASVSESARSLFALTIKYLEKT